MLHNAQVFFQKPVGHRFAPLSQLAVHSVVCCSSSNGSLSLILSFQTAVKVSHWKKDHAFCPVCTYLSNRLVRDFRFGTTLYLIIGCRILFNLIYLILIQFLRAGGHNWVTCWWISTSTFWSLCLTHKRASELDELEEAPANLKSPVWEHLGFTIKIRGWTSQTECADTAEERSGMYLGIHPTFTWVWMLPARLQSAVWCKLR